MSQQNQTQLQSSINSQINDNNAGDITALDVRGNLINMTDSLLFNSGSQILTGSLTATSLTGSLFGTASFYNETDTLQSVVNRGTFASSSTNIIFSANSNIQIRGQVGNANGTASLALGVGTNTNNYITATKTINILTNTGNTNNLGTNIVSAGGTNKEAILIVGSGSTDSQILLKTAIYSSGAVTSLKIKNQETFIYGPLTITDDDPNGIYGSLTVTGSLAVTGSSTLDGNLTVTGSLAVTGSSTLGGDLTVTGNTLLGNQLTDTTSISGSFTIVSNTNSADRALTIINATTSQTSGSVDITSTSNTAMPSVFLRTRNNSSNLMIAGTSNDTEIRFTGGELGITTLDGNITLDPSSYGIILPGLPITEPTASGQLWVSGSAGSNSKVLCVRN